MEDEPIHQLTDELQKFTSFDYPENIRSLANDAVSFFRRGNTPLPINDPESHVVRMIWTIFMNPKLAKSSPNTIVAVLNCISTDLFSSGALDRVLKGIIMVTSLEASINCDAAAILLEHAENHIIDHFPHMILIKIILSMSLSMMSHKDEMISSTTFASFPQLLDSLVKKVEFFSDNKNTEGESHKLCDFTQFRASIEEQKLNFDKQFDQFVRNPYIYILYLLFNDLTAIALDQKAKWLMLPENYKKSHLPTLIFDVLENIVHVYHVLIEREPQLICLFEPAVIQSMYDSNALQFIICFIDIYLESHKSLCNGLFEEFLSRIPTHKNVNVNLTNNNSNNNNHINNETLQSNSNKKMGSSSISSSKQLKGLKSFHSKNKKMIQHNNNSGSGNDPQQEDKAMPSELNSLALADFSLPQLSKQSISSLFFFRSIGTRQDYFASRLFTFCDDDNNQLFTRLLNTLKQYIENQLFAGTETPPRKKIHLTFKISPLRWSNLKTEKAFQKFIQKSPFETVFGIINSFVASCSKANDQPTDADKDETQTHILYDIDEKYGKFVAKKPNLSNFFRIAVLSMRMCTLETFNIPCNFLLDLLRILKFSSQSNADSSNSIIEAFNEAFDNVCNFASCIDKNLPLETQNALQISDKVGLYYTFLRHVAEKQPEICSGKWQLILDSLFKAKISLELDFASIFSEQELQSIIESAIKIIPLPVMFITNLIIANQSEKRFTIIWNVLYPFFTKALDDIDIIVATTNSLMPESINNDINDNSSTASNKSTLSNASSKGGKNKDIKNDPKNNIKEAQDSEQKIIQSRHFASMTLDLFVDIMSRAIFTESETSIISMIYTYISNVKLALEYKERILSQLKQVLTVNADVIKKTWDQLFKILSPINFKNEFASIEIDDAQSIDKAKNIGINTELLQLAFNILTLLCNDQIHKVPEKSLFNLIDLIISYGSCNVDINLSLSSFDLLWSVARAMKGNKENWKYLMEDVLKLVGDRRSDVSQCAVKTFFSLMCTSFDQIPSEVIDYFVTFGFSDILDKFDINDPSVSNSFELALQELAHYSSTFWPSFNKSAAFHDKFLPQLIEKAKNFCLTCKNNEIVTNSFHFFETMFDCPYLDDGTSELLRKSIQTMAESYLKIKDQNNIIFSCLGRTLNCLLFTLRKRNRLETLPRWYPVIQLCVTTLTAEGYIHITPQRVLDVLPSLFPMCDAKTNNAKINNDIDGIEDYDRNSLTVVYSDDKYHSDVALSVVSLLNDFLKSNEKFLIVPLKEFIFDILCQIYKTQMPNKVRLQFIVISKNIGADDCSENLSTLFVDTKIIEFVDNETAPDVFDCFMTIVGKWPSLQDKARDALISVLDRADKDAELKFIRENSKIVPKIILIWKTYFDPDSEHFNQTVYDNCFDYVLDVIGDILTEPSADSNNQLLVLNYLLESKSPTINVEKSKEETNSYHLLKLMVPLTKLISSKNDEIRELVKKLFEMISTIVSSMM